MRVGERDFAESPLDDLRGAKEEKKQSNNDKFLRDLQLKDFRSFEQPHEIPGH